MAAAAATRCPPVGAAQQASGPPPMAAAAARSAPTGAAEQAPVTDPPPWLPAGMDGASSFLLNIKIVSSHFREGISGYRFNMVIDSDTTNYKDFVAEIEEKYPWRMNETVSLHYFEESNRTVHELSTDHDMLAMFAKFGSKKTIEMRIIVHNVNAIPDKPKWPIEESAGVDVPCTPPYVGTDLANPFEENEHVGVDEEDMYSDDSDISEDEEYVSWAHKCPICKRYGHHWHSCRDGDPEQKAAMLLERGLPKMRRKKKSAIEDPQTAMVVACASTTAPVMVCPSSIGLLSQINEDVGPSSSLVRSIKGSKEPKHAFGEQKGKSKKSAPRKGKDKDAKEKIASRAVAIGELTPKSKEKCAEVAPHDSPAMGTRSKRASHSPAMSTRSKRAPVRLDL